MPNILKELGAYLDNLPQQDLGADPNLKNKLQQKFRELIAETDMPVAVEQATQYSTMVSLYYQLNAAKVPTHLDKFLAFVLAITKDLNTLQNKIVYWDNRMQFSTIFIPTSILVLNQLVADIDAYFGHTIMSNTTLNVVNRSIAAGGNEIRAALIRLGQIFQECRAFRISN